MGLFGSKKVAAKPHSEEAFAKLDRAIADALAAGISAGSLLARLEAAAEGLRWAAHNASEQRRMGTMPHVAANAEWAEKEKKRLAKEGAAMIEFLAGTMFGIFSFVGVCAVILRIAAAMDKSKKPQADVTASATSVDLSGNGGVTMDAWHARMMRDVIERIEGKA